MSTAVVLNLPEAGHMNATLPVVAELVRRGEEVVYFATERYRGAIEAAGARFMPYGDDDAFVPPAHRGGLFSVMAYLAALAESVLPRVAAETRAADPDYLLVDSMCLWGRYVQQLLRKPAITLGSVFVPDETRQDDESLVREVYGALPRETILAGIAALDSYLRTTRRIDREHGTLSPGLVGFFASRQPLNILFTSREFHVGGEAFDPATHHFVGPSIDDTADDDEASLPFTPRGDRPLIYISLGTIFNDDAQFYRDCFAALGDGLYDVVLATGAKVDVAELGAIPKNFVVRAAVPQLPLLRRASLFITHAGMNSANEALWHGVPLVVRPRHGDQHLVAARVVELGAGARLVNDATPAEIRAVVDRLLAADSVRAAAAQIGANLRAGGGFRRAADLITDYAREAAS